MSSTTLPRPLRAASASRAATSSFYGQPGSASTAAGCDVSDSANRGLHQGGHDKSPFVGAARKSSNVPGRCDLKIDQGVSLVCLAFGSWFAGIGWSGSGHGHATAVE